MSTLRRILPLLMLISALAWLGGCSSSTEPNTVTPSDLSQVDPGTGEFTLKTAAFTTPWGDEAFVALIGSNLHIDDDDALSMDIALRNIGSVPINGPITLWVGGFFPHEAGLLNHDESSPDGDAYAMIYDTHLGDEQLDPQETSAPRNWKFKNPGMGSFAFDVHVDAGLNPETAVISGYVRPLAYPIDLKGGDDPVPPPPGIMIVVTGPDSTATALMPDIWGFYATPIRAAGLYEVRATSMAMWPCGPEIVTPNPLQVIITENADGQLNSFTEANFGYMNPCMTEIPQVILTDMPAEDIESEGWTLEAGILDDTRLHLELGFSGCDPDQDFILYMTGEFSQSGLVHARLVLEHSVTQMCDAWFMEPRDFDLTPIVMKFHETFGTGGEVHLDLIDPAGQVHIFVLKVPGIPDPD